MQMVKKIFSALANSLLILVLGAGIAAAITNYVIKDGNNVSQTVLSYACQAGIVCPTVIIADATGTPINYASPDTVVVSSPYATTQTPLSAPSGVVTTGGTATATFSLVTGKIWYVSKVRADGYGATSGGGTTCTLTGVNGGPRILSWYLPTTVAAASIDEQFVPPLQAPPATAITWSCVGITGTTITTNMDGFNQ